MVKSYLFALPTPERHMHQSTLVIRRLLAAWHACTFLLAGPLASQYRGLNISVDMTGCGKHGIAVHLFWWMARQRKVSWRLMITCMLAVWVWAVSIYLMTTPVNDNSTASVRILLAMTRLALVANGASTVLGHVFCRCIGKYRTILREDGTESACCVDEHLVEVLNATVIAEIWASTSWAALMLHCVGHLIVMSWDLLSANTDWKYAAMLPAVGRVIHWSAGVVEWCLVLHTFSALGLLFIERERVRSVHVKRA